MSAERQAFTHSEDDILGHFAGWALDDESLEYLRFHSRRYAILLRVVRDIAAALAAASGKPLERLLDVGPGLLTQFLRDSVPSVAIDSLGFADPRFPCRAGDRHTEYDLTRVADAASWPRAGRYDLIVMAEVLEHLPVAPLRVLELLSALLNAGGFLVIQTPNACSLPKRLRMLAGQNPFEMIRDAKGNPGHFREYTRRELARLAAATGLTVHASFTANYFKRDTPASRIFQALEPVIPPGLRDGITMVLRKELRAVQMPARHRIPE